MLPARNTTPATPSDGFCDTADEETREQQLYERLNASAVAYRCFKHARVFTVAESHALARSATGGSVPGVAIRNLFVRDRKRRFFLLCLLSEQRLDLKALSQGADGERLGMTGRLSFANPQDLKRLLGVTPGAVNPFAVTFDEEGAVSLVLDASIAESPCFNAHPMRNDRSIALSGADFLRFLAHNGRKAFLFDFARRSPRFSA